MDHVEKTLLPSNYHDACVRWRETYLPDYDLLVENWDKFFPRDPEFQLCAYRECGMCGEIEVGADKGKPKYTRAADMDETQARQLLKAVQAQASTELGSIQQHQLTLSRAQDEQDQFWILRMMAEELRHGYQMFHVLLSDDWKSVSGIDGKDMVDEILNMRTGSHVLGAFNVDFDSFLDNVVFCAFIDRVGKYQLSMQKISSYAPMAESMPPMLREEAFHLAAGVVPLRRWVERCAKNESTFSMAMLQKTLNKWFPRGLDMFGDERGGATNVKFGFKSMKNAEAAEQYADEVDKLVHDLNLRYARARRPEWSRQEALAVCERVLQGDTVDGIGPTDLLRLPSVKFFRRRGLHTFAMVDIDGNEMKDAAAYERHLLQHMPEAYAAGRDVGHYVDLLKRVNAGELKPHEAGAKAPNLSRVGGVCPCSRAVRWVVDDKKPAATNGNGSTG